MKHALSVLAGLLLMAGGAARAADWPAAHGGTGAAEESLPAPLHLAWSYRPAHPPCPAFKGQLPHALFTARLRWRDGPLVEAITYDYAPRPVVADGKLYSGSSAEQTVTCLDAYTGREVWKFYTEGPVRFAPTLWRGAVYAGSDDGHVYCLDGETGELRWKFRAAPGPRRCVGNQRVISAWPVRTSVAVARRSIEGRMQEIAFFGAGLFPPEGTYVHAVDARTGRPIWRREVQYSPHGDILVGKETILVGSARNAPAEYRIADGECTIERRSGARWRRHGGTGLRWLGEWPAWGPHESAMFYVRFSDEPQPAVRKWVRPTILPGTMGRIHGRAVVGTDPVYLLRREALLAIGRDRFRDLLRASLDDKKATGPARKGFFGMTGGGMYEYERDEFSDAVREAALWSLPHQGKWHELIRAGDRLVVGGENSVAVVDGADGTMLWSRTVNGMARGLAVADGALFVGTEQGAIHRFQSQQIAEPRRRIPAGRPPSAGAEARQTAQMIRKLADVGKGFVFILGAGDGRLALEIARQSDFSVVVLERDTGRVREARRGLSEAALYGSRVVVHHAPQGGSAYARGLANLVVLNPSGSDWSQVDQLTAVLDMVQPYGGTLMVAGESPPSLGDSPLAAQFSDWHERRTPSGRTWQVARRGAVPGAGQWTHAYANAANTVCSGEELLGSKFTVQWFGLPGPKHTVDRHRVGHPPLANRGKLFVAGRDHWTTGVDAYNGTILWDLHVPRSTRKMASHQAGMMAADDYLFVASAGECWMLDGGTGEKSYVFQGVNAESDWGYVGCEDGLLVGSNQKRPANDYSVGENDGLRMLTNAGEIHSRPVVSENLFAFDYRSREPAWQYDNHSAILNPTITLANGRVYFAESTNPAAADNPSGTAVLEDFFKEGASLVALDLHSGREAWRVPLGPISENPEDRHERIMYLSYSDGLLLSTRTGHLDGNLGYRFTTYDAATGRRGWTQTIVSDRHRYPLLIYGKNMAQSHPSIIDGKIYMLAHRYGTMFCFDLKTGEPHHDREFGRDWEVKGCAVPTAAVGQLFYRHTTCSMYEIATHRQYDISGATRPSCWMSMVPAGGLVLMPEAGAGCTCGLSLQTSLALAPAAPTGKITEQ